MPPGKTCWMLWFSSMITRILRSWPVRAAGLAAELAAGCDPVTLAAPTGAEGPLVPWAEEQPATRRLAIRPVPARTGASGRGRASEMRPERLPRMVFHLAESDSSRRPVAPAIDVAGSSQLAEVMGICPAIT